MESMAEIKDAATATAFVDGIGQIGEDMKALLAEAKALDPPTEEECAMLGEVIGDRR